MRNKKSRIDVYVSEDVQAGFKNYLGTLDEKVSASSFLNDYILEVIGNHKPSESNSVSVNKDNRKDCYLNTRLTRDENNGYEKASKAYGFKNRNSLLLKLIREEINKAPELNEDQTQELREANKHLLGIGRNLNQIARKLNTEEISNNPITPKYVKSLVDYITNQRMAIMQMVTFYENRDVISEKECRVAKAYIDLSCISSD